MKTYIQFPPNSLVTFKGIETHHSYIYNSRRRNEVKMKNLIHRGPGVQLTLLVLLMICASVKSRQWQEIINHDIAHKSNIDSSRYELKIEVDPFLKPEEKSPSKIPTVPAKAQANTNKAWTQIGSMKDSIDSSNMTPTESLSMEIAEESSEQNSGCENGVKYEIHMMDTWGDGWDQTAITITGIDRPTSSMETIHANTQGEDVVSISKTIELASTNKNDPVGQIFQGSLLQGFHDSADICLLPHQCYQLLATGGEFSDEVSWEVRLASNEQGIEAEPIVAGGASTGCTFSLPDQSGHYFCPKTCSDEIIASETTELPPVVENLQPEEDGEIVEAVGRAVAAPRVNPVTDLMAASASAGSTESASAMWSKFQNTVGN